MKSLMMIAFTLLAFSCGHHKDVRPSDSGIHKVQFTTENKQQGYENGISQARHFCKENKKNAYVVKAFYKYSGSMKESEYKNTKKAAKVAKGIGTAAWVMGGKKESNIGGIVGLGGSVADGVAGKGYTYTMTFKCK